MADGATQRAIARALHNQMNKITKMVRKERLELSRVTPLEPKSSASTNFATFAIVTRCRMT